MLCTHPGRAALIFTFTAAVALAATAAGFRPSQATGGPTASYQVPPRLTPEVRAACDSIHAIVAKMPGASIRRRTGTFRDETLREPVFGCGLTMTWRPAPAGATGDTAERTRNALAEQGWREMLAYSADSPDGSAFALRKGQVACHGRATWDGDVDGEPPAPARTPYKLSVFCTSPAFPEKRWQR